MTEKYDEQPFRKEDELLRRAKMHKALIEFCYRKYNIKDQDRNDYGMEWVETYADNFFKQFEQAVEGRVLIQKYEQAANDDERNSVLEEIQKALEELNKVNG